MPQFKSLCGPIAAGCFLVIEVITQRTLRSTERFAAASTQRKLCEPLCKLREPLWYNHLSNFKP